MDSTGTLFLILRWGVVAATGGLSIWAITFNYSTLWKGFRKAERVPSIGPIIGGLSGFVALMLCPIEAARNYWWVPLILDPGTGLMLLYAAPLFVYMALKGEFKTKPTCRVCSQRISEELSEVLQAGRPYPENSEAIPYLVDGVCPTCGGSD